MKQVLCLLMAILLILSSALADEGWYCGSCGQANTTNFCTNCGNGRSWLCVVCGSENNKNFCGNCGAPRPAASPSTASSAGQQPVYTGSLTASFQQEATTTDDSATPDGGKESPEMLFSAYVNCLFARNAEGLWSLLPQQVRAYAIHREGSRAAALSVIMDMMSSEEWMSLIASGTSISLTERQEHVLGTAAASFPLGEGSYILIEDSFHAVFRLDGTDLQEGCFMIKVGGLWYLTAPDGNDVFWRN